MFENKHCLTNVSRWESVLDILSSKTFPLRYTGVHKSIVATIIFSTTYMIFLVDDEVNTSVCEGTLQVFQNVCEVWEVSLVEDGASRRLNICRH